MTCSLQTYRIRIGTFQAGRHIQKKTFKCNTPCTKLNKKTRFIITLLISNYCLLALSFPVLLKPFHFTNTSYKEAAWQYQPGSYTVYTACMGCPAPSLGTTRYNGSSNITILAGSNTYCAEFPIRQSEVWDPGDTTQANSSLHIQESGDRPVRTYPYVTIRTKNKMAHITNGNRGQRGKGITCVYWNNGPFISSK